jgi:hypothetical protein
MSVLAPALGLVAAFLVAQLVLGRRLRRRFRRR